MHLQHRMSVVVGITLLFAAASFAQQAKTDYDRSADFGRYKTYSWEKVQTRDPLMVGRIETAVTSRSRSLTINKLSIRFTTDLEVDGVGAVGEAADSERQPQQLRSTESEPS